MQLTLVRNTAPECEPNCEEWIMAQGRIDSEALSRFKKVLGWAGKRRLPVLVHSGGGDVAQSLAIGRLIRAKGLNVAVARTQITPCDRKDQDCIKAVLKGTLRGRAAGERSVCASACAFILAGGVRRMVGPRPVVGVHQISSFETRIKLLRTYRIETRTGILGIPVGTKKTLVSEKRVSEKTVQKKTTDGDYKRYAKYFAEMGIDQSIMPMLMSASASSLHILTPDELRKTRLETEAFDGEHLIAAPGARAAPDEGSTSPFGASYDAFKSQSP